MLQNFVIAALRHLVRNRLYSAISVFGLAVGLWMALLAALVIESELSHEHFIPGYENVYFAVHELTPQGRPTNYMTLSNSRVAALMKVRFGEVVAATRLADETLTLRHGTVEANEKIYWADANAFDVLALPVYRGDAKAALRRPDGIAIPRSIARKYFGRDDPLGEPLLLAGSQLMVVTAVLEDLPMNGTQLESGIVASGASARSKLAAIDANPINAPNSDVLSIDVLTYVRLTAGASPDRIQKAMPALMREIWPMSGQLATASMELVRIDRVNAFGPLHPGFAARLIMAAAIGGVTLLIACVNFVNLLTARTARRAMEVGIRKVSGAGRGILILQFLGESMLYVVIAAAIAVILTEISLPRVNAFVLSSATFHYWRDPAMIGWLALSTAVVGVLSGAYPAFVLSALRPVIALKGWLAQSRKTIAFRQTLVTLQFTLLITLMIAAGIVYEQRVYATREALRLRTDQMLIVSAPCNAAFVAELRALPGVRGTACSATEPLGEVGGAPLRAQDGSTQLIGLGVVELTVFDLYGVTPIAGRVSDGAAEAAPDPNAAVRLVLNETAVRRLGFTSPRAAIGQVFQMPSPQGPRDSQIIGVVPDLSLASVEHAVQPMAYFSVPILFSAINVKLSGERIPETLQAIDRLWRKTGGTGPSNRYFLDDRIQNQYLSLLRQAQVFGISSLIAAMLACLGLIGLSASTAQQRTREIGIRKALGAETYHIVLLLLWQFTRPILWANLIAWTVAAVVMRRWLQGFAYHVELDVRLFVASAALALIVALLTVSAHSLRLARANPVTALRYE
jgi:putative ABC transport system permease protein